MSSNGFGRYRGALVPITILLIAAGFAFGTAAQANPGTGDSAGAGQEVTPADDASRRAAEGSGAGNVYSQESLNDVPEGPDAGRQLYIEGCASCHGIEGGGRVLEGGIEAPPLINAGAAAVDFYVGTGRMPPAAPMKQAPRSDPVFTTEQRHAIAEYVATFGDGPPIPDVDPERGDLVEGNLLYSNNCAACHHSTGSGGAVGRDYYAPSIYAATPLQVAEAIRIGPGTMPAFGHGVFTDQQVDSIVRYVEYLKTADKPGGFAIGSLGPLSEGFIAWIVGLGAMLGVARWIGTRE